MGPSDGNAQWSAHGKSWIRIPRATYFFHNTLESDFPVTSFQQFFHLLINISKSTWTEFDGVVPSCILKTKLVGGWFWVQVMGNFSLSKILSFSQKWTLPLRNGICSFSRSLGFPWSKIVTRMRYRPDSTPRFLTVYRWWKLVLYS